MSVPLFTGTVFQKCLNGDYNENTQSSTIRFTFVNDVNGEFHELADLMACRDMLCTVLLTQLLGIEYEYCCGLSFYEKLDLKYPRMAIAMDGENSKSFEGNLDVIHSVEDLMGIPRTSFLKYKPTEVEYDDIYKYLLIVDKDWMSSPLLLSWYTLVLRAMTAISPYSPVVDPIERLLKLDNSLSDETEVIKFLDRKIDLKVFMKNWRKVIGISPITGDNDKVFRRRLKQFLKRRPNSCYFEALKYSQMDYASDRGILSFATNAHSELNRFEFINDTPSWTKNFLSIKGD